jgi:hypothetical protein
METTEIVLAALLGIACVMVIVLTVWHKEAVRSKKDWRERAITLEHSLAEKVEKCNRADALLEDEFSQTKKLAAYIQELETKLQEPLQQRQHSQELSEFLNDIHSHGYSFVRVDPSTVYRMYPT